MCMYVCMCLHMSTDDDEGQRYWISLELQLQMIVSQPTWVLATKNWGLMQEQNVLLIVAPSLQPIAC